MLHTSLIFSLIFSHNYIRTFILQNIKYRSQTNILPLFLPSIFYTRNTLVSKWVFNQPSIPKTNSTGKASKSRARARMKHLAVTESRVYELPPPAAVSVNKKSTARRQSAAFMLWKREQRPYRPNTSRDKPMWVVPLWDLGEGGGGRERRVKGGGYLIRGSLEAWNFVRVADVGPRGGSIYGGGRARERVPTTLEYKVPRRWRRRFTPRQNPRLCRLCWLCPLSRLSLINPTRETWHPLAF